MNQLVIEADALYASAQGVLDNGEQEDRMRKATEISDFLSYNGEALDNAGSSSTVDKLGNMVDRLTSNLQPRKDSVILSGAGAFATQVTHPLDNLQTSYDYTKNKAKEVLGDIKKELLPPPPPGGWSPWLIGGGILAAIIGVGYTVRAFR